jgi:hypothetical protein
VNVSGDMAELAGMDLAGNALERQPGGSHKTSVHPIVVGWISGSETSTAAGSQTETSKLPRRSASTCRPTLLALADEVIE